MNKFRIVAASAVLATLLSGGIALAQEHHDDQDHHDNHHYVHHDDWKKGGTINHDDWDRGERVDWKARHLRRPRDGREWRNVDGNYVLADSNGHIERVVVAPH